jgi:hypothetical protein
MVPCAGTVLEWLRENKANWLYTVGEGAGEGNRQFRKRKSLV